MFFTTKSTVQRQVVEAMRPKLNVLRQTGAMPRTFWQNLHLVGYLFGEAGFLLTVSTKGKYNGKNGAAGSIMMGILTDLAEDQGQVARFAADALNRKDPTFADGCRNASLCLDVAYGIDHSSHPAVVVATEAAMSLSGGTPRPADVSAMLEQRYFYAPVNLLADREARPQ
jgi:hypothetical protein